MAIAAETSPPTMSARKCPNQPATMPQRAMLPCELGIRAWPQAPAGWGSGLGWLCAVDLVGALLEGRCETAKGGVEDGAHQHAQRAAAELIGDVKLDVAGTLAGRLEAPAIVQAAERSFQILDQDLQVGPVERDAAGEGLAHQLIGDRHFGHNDVLTVFLQAFAHA